MDAPARTGSFRAVGLALVLVVAAAAGSAVGTTLRDLVRTPLAAPAAVDANTDLDYPDYGIRHPVVPTQRPASLTTPEIR
jgi:hypothetical protein